MGMQSYEWSLSVEETVKQRGGTFFIMERAWRIEAVM